MRYYFLLHDTGETQIYPVVYTTEDQKWVDDSLGTSALPVRFNDSLTAIVERVDGQDRFVNEYASAIARVLGVYEPLTGPAVFLRRETGDNGLTESQVQVLAEAVEELQLAKATQNPMRCSFEQGQRLLNEFQPPAPAPQPQTETETVASAGPWKGAAITSG